MSIWSRIAQALSALASGEGLGTLFDSLRQQPERSVGFTIAVIALGAKMAKADGHVTRDEVAAFRRVFTIPKSEEASAAKVFDLARQDVAGFDAYARKIRAMFKPSDRDVMIDLMEGLFHIAVADRQFHPAEEAFLRAVAQIFGLEDACFRSLRARHVQDDPYAVLGVDPSASDADIRKAWRNAVKAAHPDVMIARGVPPEAVKLAEERLRALNTAWEEITKARA
ncbi:MAG: molecular chaperone DjiA [Pseudomonadota bacterium]